SLMLFYVLGGLLVIASLMVVFLSSVVHSAMALVAALFLIAILFLTLHAPMVGVLQVLVYAGAIMVLFLFVIMLLNPAAVEPRWFWRRGNRRYPWCRSTTISSSARWFSPSACSESSSAAISLWS